MYTCGLSCIHVLTIYRISTYVAQEYNAFYTTAEPIKLGNNTELNSPAIPYYRGIYRPAARTV
jgi:hypothetical protein